MEKVCPYCGLIRSWSKYRESLNLDPLYCQDCFKFIPTKEWKVKE